MASNISSQKICITLTCIIVSCLHGFEAVIGQVIGKPCWYVHAVSADGLDPDKGWLWNNQQQQQKKWKSFLMLLCVCLILLLSLLSKDKKPFHRLSDNQKQITLAKCLKVQETEGSVLFRAPITWEEIGFIPNLHWRGVKVNCVLCRNIYREWCVRFCCHGNTTPSLSLSMGFILRSYIIGRMCLEC